MGNPGAKEEIHLGEKNVLSLMTQKRTNVPRVKGTATLIQTVMLVYFACSGMVMNQFLVAVALHSDIGTIASVKYTDQALNHLYPPFQAINHQPDKLS